MYYHSDGEDAKLNYSSTSQELTEKAEKYKIIMLRGEG